MLFKNFFLDYEENINFIHFGPDPAQEDVKPEFFVPSQRTFLGKVKMIEIYRNWIHLIMDHKSLTLKKMQI